MTEPEITETEQPEPTVEATHEFELEDGVKLVLTTVVNPEVL